MKIKIPENELEIKFIRSSGPGGQNVNRRATKAQLRWNLFQSRVLDEKQKQQIQIRLANLITKAGDLIIENETTRYQAQNKKAAVDGLHDLISQALKKKKKRIPTKTPRSVIEKRLTEKKRTSEKKKSRKKIKDY
jgi:ribosome-associated protein